MTIQFTQFNKKVSEIFAHLVQEFSSIRTSRATPMILDDILVEAYGTLVKIKEVGSIGVEDPSTVRVTPWEAGMGKAIEKAIIASNLGLGVSSDDKGVRVIFPPLTEERRQGFVKLLKEKLESARVALRTARDKEVADLDAKEKAGGVGKDDIFRAKQELQKIVDQGNKTFQELAMKKEKEIIN